MRSVGNIGDRFFNASIDLNPVVGATVMQDVTREIGDVGQAELPSVEVAFTLRGHKVASDHAINHIDLSHVHNDVRVVIVDHLVEEGPKIVVLMKSQILEEGEDKDVAVSFSCVFHCIGRLLFGFAFQDDLIANLNSHPYTTVTH
jgi:hypothetical protein